MGDPVRPNNKVSAHELKAPGKKIKTSVGKNGLPYFLALREHGNPNRSALGKQFESLHHDPFACRAILGLLRTKGGHADPRDFVTYRDLITRTLEELIAREPEQKDRFNVHRYSGHNIPIYDEFDMYFLNGLGQLIGNDTIKNVYDRLARWAELEFTRRILLILLDKSIESNDRKKHRDLLSKQVSGEIINSYIEFAKGNTSKKDMRMALATALQVLVKSDDITLAHETLKKEAQARGASLPGPDENKTEEARKIRSISAKGRETHNLTVSHFLARGQTKEQANKIVSFIDDCICYRLWSGSRTQFDGVDLAFGMKQILSPLLVSSKS